MKKIISLFVAVLLLCALTVPAMANPFAMNFEDGKTILGGNYIGITIDVDARVTIESEVTLSNGGRTASLTLNPNSTLVIGSNGYLMGTGVLFGLFGSDPRIELEEGGGLYIEFVNSSHATNFEDFLNNIGITCYRNGNTVQAGSCPHTNKTTTRTTATDTVITTTVNTKTTVTTTDTTTCDDCGTTVSTEVSTDTSETTETTVTTDPAPTASTLSEGSLVIVCSVAAAVVFGLGGFILGTKKKKPALASGTDNTDEE